MSLQDRFELLKSRLSGMPELFDHAGYAQRYGLPLKVDPVRHYLEEGASAGCEPNDLFLSDFYREAAGVSLSSSQTPLEHFVASGLVAGVSPHPLFNSGYYQRSYAEVGRSGLHPYLYYLKIGFHTNQVPTPLFDANWYRGRYPYYQREMGSSFRHYLRVGYKTDNSPSDLFDLKWYKSIYGPPVHPNADSLSEFAWRCASNMPNPLFDTWFYNYQYPDAKANGVSALEDYVVSGWRNGRLPNPLFDGGYYLERYSDVRDADVEPLGHYLHYGCRERRDPTGLFSTRYYLSQIPNGIQTVENPLKHYLWEGAAKGINPHPSFDTAEYLKQAKLDRHGNPLINLLLSRVDSVSSVPDPIPETGSLSFYSRQLAANGLWNDGWCASQVSLSFIASSTARVSFELWTPLTNQIVRILVDGDDPREISLPKEELVKISAPILIAKRKTIVQLVFGEAKALSESDPRPAAAILKNIEVRASEYSRAKRSDVGGGGRGSASKVAVLAGDIIWSIRYARHKGLRQGIAKLMEIRGLRAVSFDRDYYLSQDPFKASPATEVVRHYAIFGVHQNLDPHPSFSTEFYMNAHEDISRAGINPYLHFNKYGAAEGRRSEPSGAFQKKKAV